MRSSSVSSLDSSPSRLDSTVPTGMELSSWSGSSLTRTGSTIAPSWSSAVPEISTMVPRTSRESPASMSSRKPR